MNMSKTFSRNFTREARRLMTCSRIFSEHTRWSRTRTLLPTSTRRKMSTTKAKTSRQVNSCFLQETNSKRRNKTMSGMHRAKSKNKSLHSGLKLKSFKSTRTRRKSEQAMKPEAKSEKNKAGFNQKKPFRKPKWMLLAPKEGGSHEKTVERKEIPLVSETRGMGSSLTV